MPYTVNMRIHNKDGSVRDKIDNCILSDEWTEVWEKNFMRNKQTDHDYFEAVKHPTAEENRQN